MIGTPTRRIKPEYRIKLWGSASLAPWFDPRPDELVGEVWFPAGDLLIKFLFTSANLSVQVHPGDDYARRRENSSGKTEMWYILRAEPGASIALGFKEAISADRVAEASLSGEVMDLLKWIEVQPQETYFVPAGTVHAIGAGLALCEIQQNSDLTYRLFDYGRDRELHLGAAKEVLRGEPHPGKSYPRDLGNGLQLLAECPYFGTYRTEVQGQREVTPSLAIRVVVVTGGIGSVNGLPASPGNVFEMADSGKWLLQSEDMQVLLIA
jgi:mannose-6-phosphate isomerase